MSLEDEDAFLDRTVPWFNNKYNPGDDPEAFQIYLTVNNVKLDYLPIDTGSTGFLLSATTLNYRDDSDLKKTCEPAFQYLSSSRRYYQGYWLPSKLTFTSVTGKEMHSYIPVLAVTERGICSSYKSSTDCTKEKVEFMPDRIQYMGVGFGRWGPEQPNGTADKNALLNVDFEDDPSLKNGFIIGGRGLVLGIRAKDLTNNWRLTKLDRNTGDTKKPSVAAGRAEWAGTSMCVEVSYDSDENSSSSIKKRVTSDCFHGTALFDTGIPHCYIGIPPSVTDPIKLPYKTKSWILKGGVTIAVKIGPRSSNSPSASSSVTDFAAVYLFTTKAEGTMPSLACPWSSSTAPETESDSDDRVGIDPASLTTPTRVQLTKEHSDGAFVNTGRMFFNQFDLLFDELSGTVGLRQKIHIEVKEEEEEEGWVVVDDVGSTDVLHPNPNPNSQRRRQTQEDQQLQEDAVVTRTLEGREGEEKVRSKLT